MEEIIVRSLQGRASADEERALSNWRQASSSNDERYRELQRLWSLIRDVEAPVVSSVPSVGDIIRSEGTSQSAAADTRRGDRARFSWRSWGAAAAAVVVLALGISQADFGASHVAELSTGTGEMATLRLPDGSVVRLAPRSRLLFSGTPDAREVWLEGRAFFAVAKQEGAPFRVRSHAGDALVLGTRFDIRIEEDNMRVLVVEGRVALSSGVERVEVTAGELSYVAAGAEPSVVKVPDVQRMLEWLGEFLVFQATPLDQFAREFEQHYGIRVRILDATLANRTVTGWFTDQPAEDVLMMVCHAADVQCSVRNGVANIQP